MVNRFIRALWMPIRHAQRPVLERSLVVAAVMSDIPRPKMYPRQRGSSNFLAPPRDANQYYPAASLRAGASGWMVLHFTLDAEGRESRNHSPGMSVSKVSELFSSRRSGR
jgi:hypothetical protein